MPRFFLRFFPVVKEGERGATEARRVGAGQAPHGAGNHRVPRGAKKGKIWFYAEKALKNLYFFDCKGLKKLSEFIII